MLFQLDEIEILPLSLWFYIAYFMEFYPYQNMYWNSGCRLLHIPYHIRITYYFYITFHNDQVMLHIPYYSTTIIIPYYYTTIP